MSLNIVNATELCTKKGLGAANIRRFENLGFSQIVVHDVAPLRHNTVYIFSTMYDLEQFKPKKIKIKGFSKTQIDLAESLGWKKYGIKSSSLNVATQEPGLGAIVDEETVKIIYTEREQQDSLGEHACGWYDPSNNVLCIPDITHNVKTPEKTLQRVRWLLDQLEAYQEKNKTLVDKAQNEIREAVSSFMMGSDIEFEVFDGDILVGADRFYPGLNDEIGRDGHRETGELRPKPSRDPLVLADNTKKLLKDVHDYLPKGYKIYCGGGKKVPIGLHIHFSGIPATTILVSTLDALMKRPIQRHQSGIRNESPYGNRDGEVRDQPHGWEYRPLMTTMESPLMLESVFCVAYGIAKAITCGDSVNRVAQPSTYRDLPNYGRHKKQIDFFIKRFVESDFKAMEGKDIRKSWFDYMPDKYGVRRHKFLDDDRMEWLYRQLEDATYDDLMCNWIVNASLGRYGTPEILVIGAPREVVAKVAAMRPSLRFGVGKEKIYRHEVLFSINIQVTKRCVIDKKYALKVGGACVDILRETVGVYKQLKDEGKDPDKCNMFKEVWHMDPLTRGKYRPDAGFVVVAENNVELPDLTQLGDKDLAVLAALYGDEDSPEARAILEEVRGRNKPVRLKVRGQYDTR